MPTLPGPLTSHDAWSGCTDAGAMIAALITVGADRNRLAHVLADIAASTSVLCRTAGAPAAHGVFTVRRWAFGLANEGDLFDCLHELRRLLRSGRDDATEIAVVALELVLFKDAPSLADVLVRKVTEAWVFYSREEWEAADRRVRPAVARWTADIVRRLFPWKNERLQERLAHFTKGD